jgi:DNA-binding response OmpR family regulator
MREGLFNGKQGSRRGGMIKVLVAEDNVLVADLIEDAIADAGYDVCGIARTVPEAVELDRRHRPDLAVIDLQLADGMSGTEIGCRLSTRDGVGILYSTGDISRVSLTSAEGHACLCKPYSVETLLRSLEIVSAIAAAKTSLPPFPPGFRLLTATPALNLIELK